MSVPSILLLTGVPPSDMHVGGIYLRDLCKWYPHDSICCFHTEGLPNGTPSRDLAWLPMRYVPGPSECDWPSHRHEVQRLIRSGIQRYHETVTIPRLVWEAVRFGKEHGVEMVWAPLHAPTSVLIAQPVAKKLGVPLVTTVWDPPEYVATCAYHVDRFTLGRLLRAFDEAVSCSLRCAVASGPMQSLYENKYSVPCIPMTYAAQCPKPEPASRNSQDEAFVIGYAGSLYAHDEWNALLEALEETKWQIGKRPVKLGLLGHSFPLCASNPVRIEYMGWHTQVETLRHLSGCDIGYLPYWFDKSFAVAARLSFPGKLATYVSANLPCFFHGPDYSSVTAFMSRYPIGIACHSLDSDLLLEQLRQFASDPQTARHARHACIRAYNEELSPAIFRMRFAQLIGIEESDLLPM